MIRPPAKQLSLEAARSWIYGVRARISLHETLVSVSSRNVRLTIYRCMASKDCLSNSHEKVALFGSAYAAIFGWSSDHREIGRIQGRQFAALLQQGGSIIYIQGPAENSAAKERTSGMQESKPSNIHFTLLRAQWTEESAQRSVRSWLKLSTSQKATIDLVGAQDDSMAIGARKAFEELPNESEQERWLKLPFTGCYGLPETVDAWGRSGLLAATVFVPPNTGLAIAMTFQAIQKRKPAGERGITVP